MTSYLYKGIYKIPELSSALRYASCHVQNKAKASSKVDHNSTIKQETRERERDSNQPRKTTRNHKDKYETTNI